jgi:hypothetical protein
MTIELMTVTVGKVVWMVMVEMIIIQEVQVMASGLLSTVMEND